MKRTKRAMLYMMLVCEEPFCLNITHVFRTLGKAAQIQASSSNMVRSFGRATSMSHLGSLLKFITSPKVCFSQLPSQRNIWKGAIFEAPQLKTYTRSATTFNETQFHCWLGFPFLSAGYGDWNTKFSLYSGVVVGTLASKQSQFPAGSFLSGARKHAS